MASLSFDMAADRFWTAVDKLPDPTADIRLARLKLSARQTQHRAEQQQLEAQRIAEKARRANRGGRGNRIDEDIAQEIRRLRAIGKSYPAIADAVGVAVKTAWTVMQRGKC